MPTASVQGLSSLHLFSFFHFSRRINISFIQTGFWTQISLSRKSISKQLHLSYHQDISKRNLKPSGAVSLYPFTSCRFYQRTHNIPLLTNMLQLRLLFPRASIIQPNVGQTIPQCSNVGVLPTFKYYHIFGYCA